MVTRARRTAGRTVRRDAGPTKAGIPHGQHGNDGARTFWQQHRDVFDSIEASFSHTVTDDGVANLEWSSEGTLRDGTDSGTTASASSKAASKASTPSARTTTPPHTCRAEKRSALST
jgi:hypothetical protein